MAERGEVASAYAGAKDLVRRRPEWAEAHFTLSYVLRYAGMLPQATHECDVAMALDGGNYEFRSCAWAFLELGRTQRAMDFARLDAGSEWAAYITFSSLLREGKIEQARTAVKNISANPFDRRDFLEACMQPNKPSDFETIARKTETAVLTESDPETRYYQGAAMAYCGETDEAARLINSAIWQNYCAVSALQSDPLLATLRKSAAFPSLLTAAQQCQTKMLESVKQPVTQ
jgi:hypothetical protein